MPSPVVENKQPIVQEKSLADRRNLYKQALGETQMSFTSNDVPRSFTPQPGYDAANGTLPGGELGLDQIANFIPK